MPAATHRIILEEGATWTVRFKWLWNDLSPVDILNDFFIRFTARDDKPGEGGAVIFELDESMDSIVVNYGSEPGTFVIQLTAAETAAYSFTKAWYTLEAIHMTKTQITDASWTTSAIDVDGGGSTGTITANAGTPFSGVNVGDYVKVVWSENSWNNPYTRTDRPPVADSMNLRAGGTLYMEEDNVIYPTVRGTYAGNDGTYKVGSKTDTVLTFTDYINGSDNADDTNLTGSVQTGGSGLFLATKSTIGVVRLLEGTIKLSREIAES